MMRRTLPLPLTLLVLAAFALLPTGCSRVPTEEESTPTPLPTPIVPTNPTYTVQRGEVVKQVEFTGLIAPVVEQELFFRAGGRVRNVFVQQGDFVTAGQLLADLGIDDLERALALDQLALRRAEVNLEIARLRLEMARAQDPASEHEIAIKEYEVELARIALEETSLGVQDLQAAIADAQIIAPFDGQVISLRLSEGREVDAFKPVVIIADPGELEVSADLTDFQLQDLFEGMPVTVVLAHRPGQKIEGEIRRLPYPYGSGEDGDETARVALAATAAGAGFERGDRVRVTVVVERKKDVLWLPPQAIRTFGGREFVVVRDGALQRRVDVKPGLRTEDRIEIESGLTGGQVVIGE